MRRIMSAGESFTLSQIICERAATLLDWGKVQTVHIYRPLAIYHEVDTEPLIELIIAANPSVRIASWHKTADDYNAHWLDTDEPVKPQVMFDVVVVPLLGFNDDCQRIGFGGGFYDRFLAQQPHAQTIGLCYESGKVSFAAEAHDIPLAHIITEVKTYGKPRQ